MMSFYNPQGYDKKLLEKIIDLCVFATAWHCLIAWHHPPV